MSTKLLIDKNVTLTLKSATGTPSFSITGSKRAVGSITLTENPPPRTLVRTADGKVAADVETGDPDSFGTVTVTLFDGGDTFADGTANQFNDIVRALMFQDPTKIAGTAWVSTFTYSLGGGCEFAVDMDLTVSYCSGGSTVTKTLSLGAVTVRGGISHAFGEASTSTPVTFDLLEEVNFLSWS